MPDTLDARRRVEIARYDEAYEDPRYNMKRWRQELLREWLMTAKAVGHRTYLDVGCGRGESLQIACFLGFTVAGCEVVESLCGSAAVEHIRGAHDLRTYSDDSVDVVSCLDVMEHILEDDVPGVLREIWRVANHAVLLGISCKAGPMHPTIFPPAWWVDQVEANMGGNVSVIFEDKIKPIKQPYVWISVE